MRPGGNLLTKQSMAAECDINNIMANYQNTGLLPDMIKTNPVYGDFSDPQSYQEAMNIVLFAEEQFLSLSAHVRERFGNDPQKFLEFTSDPKNQDEMEKLGLTQSRRSNDDTPEAPQPIASKKGSKKIENKPSEDSDSE